MNQHTGFPADTSFSSPIDAHLLIQKYSYSYNKTYKKDIKFIQMLFPDFNYTSYTFYISIILCTIYLIVHGYFFHPNTPLSIDITKQYSLGLNRYFISDEHEWFRIITATIFHPNVWSLLINIYFFMNIGIIVEQKYGTTKYLLYLLFSMIWGNVTTVACIKCIEIYMGISSILAGYVGLFLAEILMHYKNLVDPLSIFVNFIFTSFMLLLMTTTMIHNGNIFGNIGGFLGGLSYVYIINNTSHQSDSMKKSRIGFTVFSIIYLGLCTTAIVLNKCAYKDEFIFT